MSFSVKGESKFISEINVTPLVDVMLVLLIIFMVTAPMLIQGENVELPESGSGNIAGESIDWVISINKNQELFFNDNKIEISYLKNYLIDKLREESSQPKVYIKGDKDVSYGAVISVMSTIKEAGIKNVGMITKPVTQDH